MLIPTLPLDPTPQTYPPAMTDLVDSMLDLMRRLPPTNVEGNVNSLIELCPDYADDLLGRVDLRTRSGT